MVLFDLSSILAATNIIIFVNLGFIKGIVKDNSQYRTFSFVHISFDLRLLLELWGVDSLKLASFWLFSSTFLSLFQHDMLLEVKVQIMIESKQNTKCIYK